MTLEEARLALDGIDAQLARLFDQRMQVIDRIAVIKQGSGAPVHNPAREAAVTGRLLEMTGTVYREELLALYDAIFAISRARQEHLAAQAKEQQS
ncbi:MAG TPA: chorismate mutase [Clostridia bacterium]|jgi:chorismate mutase|nr:chorismate mutase [Clostridia bacterium]HQA97269.1 chorismate mutase [Clostridia bacterium]HQO55778.1 chorismate mutase [Clostridia bacterium]HUM61062.1 chorismate mutase [Clostridia bacterium]